MNGPIFIVGVGRSGTTLLQAMLNAHPRVSFPRESHFLRRYVVPELHGELPRELSDARARLSEDAYFERLDIAADLALRPFDDDSFSYAALYRRLLALHAERAGADWVGDKDPEYIWYLPEISALFAEARVVHILRDPRDVILSRTRARWGRVTPFVAHVAACRAALRRRAGGQQMFGARYIEVRYEDLVADPEPVLRRVCQRIGLEPDGQMLEFHTTSGDLVDESEKEWKRAVLGPLRTENVGLWRNGLSRWQVALIEGACGDVMDELAYERAWPRLDRAVAPALSIAETGISWARRLRQRLLRR